jgi:hypothetical protein
MHKYRHNLGCLHFQPQRRPPVSRRRALLKAQGWPSFTRGLSRAKDLAAHRKRLRGLGEECLEFIRIIVKGALPEFVNMYACMCTCVCMHASMYVCVCVSSCVCVCVSSSRALCRNIYPISTFAFENTYSIQCITTIRQNSVSKSALPDNSFFFFYGL